MDNNNLLLIEKRLITRFLDTFIRFRLILALASSCFTVFSPFTNMMLWALILAAVPYPLYQYFVGSLAGKQGSASVVLVLLGILLIAISTVLMITSLVGSVSAMINKMGSQSFTIPPPSSRTTALPIIGERLSALWMRTSVDLPGLLSNYRSQIGDVAKQFLSILASMGDGSIGFIISFTVPGVMMVWGAAGAISVQRTVVRITDENKGVTLTRLRTSIIRAVAQGVTGVALIQALLVGVIMLMANILAVGISFILALILGTAQVPVILVTASATALTWSFGTHSTGIDIFYTILMIVAGMADNVLKPLLLGCGVDAPMPVVPLGALGGVTSNGIFGMFLGAILLVIDYRIFMIWANEGQPALPQDR